MVPRKPPQPQVSGLPKKSLLEPESSEVPPTPPSKPECSEPHPHSSQPNFSILLKKPPQPEVSANLRKQGLSEVSGHPKKSLPQIEFTEAPQAPPSRPESSEPHPHSLQPDFSTFPRKIPLPQLSDLPKKPLQPEFGNLTRTSSEPEVSVFPKRPRQSEFKALSKKPPQPELGGLPRTSSEPEFNLLPQKFLQPECQGHPRKFSQPEATLLPKKLPQAEFLGDLPRKPPLPGSVSESSLPTAVAGSSSRFPLSPGFGARQQRSALTRSVGSRLGFKPGHPPRRRPLPPISSLGPPPAKPPLPPGPRTIQSFWRTSAADTGGSGQPRQKVGAEVPRQGPPPSLLPSSLHSSAKKPFCWDPLPGSTACRHPTVSVGSRGQGHRSWGWKRPSSQIRHPPPAPLQEPR